MSADAPGPESPELAAAREARSRQAALAAAGSSAAVIPPPPIHDPLSLCIATTVALIAWVISPALTAAIFGLVGLRSYWRAWRAGLRQSDCVLVDPRLVMLYLGLVALAGLAFTAWRVARYAHLSGGIHIPF
jgi:hypothetical protein